MERIIEVRGLAKSYGSIQAVRGLDFYVARGKLFAFLGPNGAGKSTTVEILSTALKKDQGEVTINGFTLGREDDKIRPPSGWFSRATSWTTGLRSGRTCSFAAAFTD